MGILEDIFGDKNSHQFQSGVDAWEHIYSQKGLHVSDNVKPLMHKCLECWSNPSVYPANYFYETVIQIEQLVHKENGKLSEARNFEELKPDLEEVNRMIYFKDEAPQGSDVVPPDELRQIEREQDEIFDDIYTQSGGVANVKKMETWAESNLTGDELEIYYQPFRELYNIWGTIAFQRGKSLREQTDSDVIVRCREAVLYLEALYKQRK